MKFLVFIKQVPEASDIQFDPDRKTLIRESVKNIMNPYDRRAISEAVRYRNERGGEAIAVTMGPPQAREVLLEALLMGVDRAVHILDPRLAGSDTLATSRVLAAAARRLGFDLLLCGQHSTDSETAQVPPEIGELLGIPCAAAVRKIDYRENEVRVWCETDEGTMVADLRLPAILSTAERLIKPIKVKDIPLSEASAEKIEQCNLDDLGIDPSTVGLSGSPTWVAAIYEQSISRRPQVLEAADIRITAEMILEIIRGGSVLKDLPEVPASSSQHTEEIWCLIEFSQDKPRTVSLEILANASALAVKKGARVCGVAIGSPVSPSDHLSLHSNGADLLYLATSAVSHPDEAVSLLCEKIHSLRPYAFLLPATSQGKYLAPRIAARLQLGLTGDCVGLQIDEEGRLVQLKPAFGGNIVAPIYSRTYPQMATIRPGALDSYRPRPERVIPVIEWTAPQASHRFEVVSREPDQGIEAEKMEEADIIVCAGMGLGQQNLPLAFSLAGKLKAAMGATRRVVDSGWMPRQFQIGLTGKFVAPHVYLGLGVSGRFNHCIGIQKAGTIIAVNSDPAADIFKIADIGVIGDCVAVVETMIQQL